MRRTYFRQKLKKYALQLFALQGFVIVALLSLLTFQLLQDHHQEKQFFERMEFDYQTFADITYKTNQLKRNLMSLRVEKTHRAKLWLDCAEKIIKYRGGFDKKIAKAISVPQTKLALSADELLTAYFEGVEEILFKEHQKIYERLDVEMEAFKDYSLPDYKQVLQQYDYLETPYSKIAYLQKVRSEMLLIEHIAVEYLFSKLPSEPCIYDKYYTHVIAPNRLWQDETTNARITFTENPKIRRPTFIVEGKGVALDADGTAIYQMKTKKLGKHLLEGKVIMQNNWGKTMTYPFTHEYTVLPKCN